MKRFLMTAVVGVALAASAGCTTYYKVSDTSTNKVYYTKQLDRENNGAVSFTDAQDGAQVTIQNSSVETITQQQFQNGKNDVKPAP